MTRLKARAVLFELYLTIGYMRHWYTPPTGNHMRFLFYCAFSNGSSDSVSVDFVVQLPIVALRMNKRRLSDTLGLLYKPE